MLKVATGLIVDSPCPVNSCIQSTHSVRSEANVLHPNRNMGCTKLDLNLKEICHYRTTSGAAAAVHGNESASLFSENVNTYKKGAEFPCTAALHCSCSSFDGFPSLYFWGGLVQHVFFGETWCSELCFKKTPLLCSCCISLPDLHTLTLPVLLCS